MKLLSRDFTGTEKLLILFLSLVLIGLSYYWLVDQPVKRDIFSANAERDALELELTAVEAKAAQLRGMREELDRLGSLEEASRMDSYNNSKAELALLNGVLESADTYSVAFADVRRDGDQIRRNFTLQFTTGSYDGAKHILSQLSQSEYRCLIGDVRYAAEWRPASGGGASAGNTTARRYVITVNTMATFFETMYGGTPDAGLPSDSGANG